MAYGHYVAAYNRMHNTLEYPGYDNEMILGRRGNVNVSYYGDDDYYYDSSYPSYRSYHHYATPSRYHTRSYYDAPEIGYREWSEAPLTLGVSLCCHDCKIKLGKRLRKIHGVHDVDISGWTPARVTVTGSANPEKILKTARKQSNTAHWMDAYSRDNYYNHENRHRHWPRWTR